jgi:hypothetical protein
MTTHFSNGVTNVPGKMQGSSLFTKARQPIITGNDNEFAYQSDFVKYNASDWTITETAAASTQAAQYANGWLVLGDDGSPTANDVNMIEGANVFNYQSTKGLAFETSIASIDVSEANIFAGLANDGATDPASVPRDSIGFHHAEDTTSIQFVISKDATATSTDVLDAPGGSAIVFADSTVATQTATVGQIPSNSVRLGFRFIPAGQEGVTTGTFRIYYNGNPVQDVTTLTNVPDDIGLGVQLGTNTKSTTTTNLMVDYVKVLGERVS